MILVPFALGLLGLLCLMLKRSLLGMLMGVQFLVLGVTLAFVIAGSSSGKASEGSLFAFFILLGGIVQLVAGYAFAIRMFYLKRSVGIETIR